MADAFVLTLLHFNLQYCAGGLDGLFTVDWPTDNDSIEDQIIVESFAPVLDMLEEHPTWSIDLELQAYMVEVLATRHRDVLDQLRTLAHAGQVELVSFHYSDQLWTAYPWRDQEVSLARTRAIFEAYDLPLSEVVFTQEGQFGEGMLRRMPEEGYRVAVMPHNLAEYTWGAEPTEPVFRYGDDVLVVMGGTGAAGGGGAYTMEWSFLNDGELYATGDLDPYLGPAFLYDPEALQRRADELVAAEAAGKRIVSVGAFAAAIEGYEAPELPPVIDGTWQPDDTDNLYRWMGGSGLWATSEADNLVRTTVMAARHVVAAAEVVPGVDEALVADAWQEVLLAQVSDATGWNPYPTEVQYALDHAAEAVALAGDAIADACAAEEASTALVDLTADAVTWDEEAPTLGTPGGEAWLTPTYGARGGTEEWGIVAADIETLDITLPKGDGTASVTFPWDAEVIATMPALLEEVVTLDAAAVAYDPVGLALPAGLLRLEDGLWLVERTDRTHLAARLSRADGTVTFQDETTQGAEVTWSFLVVRGDEARAAEVALATNVYPVVSVPCGAAPETDQGLVDKAAACAGCATSADSGAPAAALLVGLAALGLRRRR